MLSNTEVLGATRNLLCANFSENCGMCQGVSYKILSDRQVLIAAPRFNGPLNQKTKGFATHSRNLLEKLGLTWKQRKGEGGMPQESAEDISYDFTHVIFTSCGQYYMA
jgi:hypothetical protein